MTRSPRVADRKALCQLLQTPAHVAVRQCFGKRDWTIGQSLVWLHRSKKEIEQAGCSHAETASITGHAILLSTDGHSQMGSGRRRARTAPQKKRGSWFVPWAQIVQQRSTVSDLFVVPLRSLVEKIQRATFPEFVELNDIEILCSSHCPPLAACLLGLWRLLHRPPGRRSPLQILMLKSRSHAFNFVHLELKCLCRSPPRRDGAANLGNNSLRLLFFEAKSVVQRSARY